MEYVLAIGLTFLLSLAIINIVAYRVRKSFTRVIYRQSDTHKLLKDFFAREIINTKKNSQLEKRSSSNSLKVIVIDQKAYWVVNNIFYVADLVDGKPDTENANPVDTSNMSKHDIDKLLFILDNLKEGETDERGSTGNK